MSLRLMGNQYILTIKRRTTIGSRMMIYKQFMQIAKTTFKKGATDNDVYYHFLWFHFFIHCFVDNCTASEFLELSFT